MLTQNQRLDLQAYFDGELPAGEAREVADWLAGNAEASALLTEWQHTRGAMAFFDADLKLPESREFYWSKIERAIEQAERPAPEAAPISWLTAWRWRLAPIAVLTALVLAVFLTLPRWRVAANPEVESSLADAGAFTYRDYANGTTLVWLSYPAENGLAQTESDDILD